MSKLSKILDKVIRGNADNNIRFGDLCALLLHLNFSERVRGDHHIFSRDDVEEILNIQPKGGKAKAYQVKQVRVIISSHGLAWTSTTDGATENETSSDTAISKKTEGDENDEC